MSIPAASDPPGHEPEAQVDAPAGGASLPAALCGALLRAARVALQRATAGMALPVYHSDHPLLAAPTACFVTLRRGDTGELRGCRGAVRATEPLLAAVVAMTAAAALDDDRFAPVTAAEASQIHIEISVLSPQQRVQPEDVVVGRDGLLLVTPHGSGLLLPQVAGEWGWGRAELLAALCRKAGVAPGAWRAPDAQLFAFQCAICTE